MIQDMEILGQARERMRDEIKLLDLREKWGRKMNHPKRRDKANSSTCTHMMKKRELVDTDDEEEERVSRHRCSRGERVR